MQGRIEFHVRIRERIGIKPLKKRERKDFMMQCAGWPKSAVSCLAGANESQDVLNCETDLGDGDEARDQRGEENPPRSQTSRGRRSDWFPKK